MTDFAFPRGSERFVGVKVSVDGAETDPVKVAFTDSKAAPAKADAAWVDPVAGEISGTSYVGVMTTGLAPGKHYVWAYAADVDEWAPVLAGSVKLT